MDWPKPSTRIVLRGGDTAIYKGIHPITGKHQALTGKTVWLLDDDGLARGDKQPCPQDWTGTLL
jgi:hypothetical protein